MNRENISLKSGKIFLQQRVATQNGKARRGAYLGGGSLGYGAENKVSGVGRLERGAHSWDLHTFLLLMLSFLQKLRNINCEQGCERK